MANLVFFLNWYLLGVLIVVLFFGLKEGYQFGRDPEGGVEEASLKEMLLLAFSWPFAVVFALSSMLTNLVVQYRKRKVPAAECGGPYEYAMKYETKSSDLFPDRGVPTEPGNKCGDACADSRTLHDDGECDVYDDTVDGPYTDKTVTEQPFPIDDEIEVEVEDEDEEVYVLTEKGKAYAEKLKKAKKPAKKSKAKSKK